MLGLSPPGARSLRLTQPTLVMVVQVGPVWSVYLYPDPVVERGGFLRETTSVPTSQGIIRKGSGFGPRTEQIGRIGNTGGDRPCRRLACGQMWLILIIDLAWTGNLFSDPLQGHSLTPRLARISPRRMPPRIRLIFARREITECMHKLRTSNLKVARPVARKILSAPISDD
jgi:hypothetical protein